MQRLCTPARNDTTSEPTVGNNRPGAPVTEPMSGGLVRNQGGTVEYYILLYPTPDYVRGGIFIFAPSENTFMWRYHYGKRKPVHL